MQQQSPCLQPFLDRLMSRSPLSFEQQQVVLNLPVRREQVRANNDLHQPSGTFEAVYVVAAGLVGWRNRFSDGKRRIAALYIAGDAVNLQSAILPNTDHELSALSDCTLLKIPCTAIRAIAAAHPAVAAAFWRDNAVDLAILTQWLSNAGGRDGRARLAHLFCEMATRYGLADEQGEIAFRLPMTQVCFAEAVGLTPVHVNRVLRQLEADALTVCRFGTVQIRDWLQLVQVAAFDPGYLNIDGPAVRMQIRA